MTLKKEPSLKKALEDTIHNTLTPEKKLRAAQILREFNTNEAIRLAQLLEREAKLDHIRFEQGKHEIWGNRF